MRTMRIGAHICKSSGIAAQVRVAAISVNIHSFDMDPSVNPNCCMAFFWIWCSPSTIHDFEPAWDYDFGLWWESDTAGRRGALDDDFASACTCNHRALWEEKTTLSPPAGQQ